MHVHQAFVGKAEKTTRLLKPILILFDVCSHLYSQVLLLTKTSCNLKLSKQRYCPDYNGSSSFMARLKLKRKAFAVPDHVTKSKSFIISTYSSYAILSNTKKVSTLHSTISILTIQFLKCQISIYCSELMKATVPNLRIMSHSP